MRKYQPIRTGAAQQGRQRVVAQQAGIDCDAAMRAVRVPTGSDQPDDAEFVDTILRPMGWRKTFRDVPASIGHVRLQLEMAQEPKPFQHAVIKVAVQKSDRRRNRSSSNL